MRGQTKRKKFNTRGKISQAIGGYGNITRKGYRRIWDTGERRFKMEHIVVWEKHNGKIPEGYSIHHKDGNKLNNNITNLELVKALTHKRIHSGCKLINGEWWKPCRKCGEIQRIDNYYKRKVGISPWCKICCIRNAVENKLSEGKCDHPTVKPIALMEYLIKLVSKEGAVVLDPFLGSGTTLLACYKLNRNGIGIEKEEEYIKIAQARLNKLQEQTKLSA